MLRKLFRACQVCLAISFLSALAGQASGQALGCGGIEPKLVLYAQGSPTTTTFTVTGVTAPSLIIDLDNTSGTTFDTITPTSEGGGTYTFSVNSGILGLGVTSVEAWNVAANGSETFCDAAYLNLQTPAPSVSVGSCGSAAGNWTFAVDGETYGPLNLTQSGSSLSGASLSGTLTHSNSECDNTEFTWSVSGTYTSYSTNSNGSLSVTATKPNPTESPNGCVAATNISLTGDIPYLSCNTANGNAVSTIPGQGTQTGTFTLAQSCPMPSGETPSFDTWESAKGLNTEAGFSVQVQPTSTDFAGRILSESASPGSINDTCYNSVPGSAVSLPNPDSIWAVTNSDFYSSDDMIGYTPAAVYYYRLQLYRITGGTSFSCGFTLQQVMHMNSCGSSSVFTAYGGSNSGDTNTLGSTITATTVSSRRGNASSGTLTFP
jgi:hypothetical protein